MTRVLVIGAGASWLAAVASLALREAGVAVCVVDEGSPPPAEFMIEAQPDFPALEVGRMPVEPLTYGPSRNRKKGKAARW